MKKKSLVTGATGFIGQWLTERLYNEGHEVHVLVRSESSAHEIKAYVHKIHIGDVTRPDTLRIIESMDEVYHLAGVVAYDPRERSTMEKVNVGGTANIVEACLKNQNVRLIYLSSVVAIGASENPAQLDEESPFELSKYNLGYFETKRAAEKIVLDACKNQNLNAICICPSTVYGPGDAKKGSRKMQIKVAQGRLKFFTGGGVSIVSIHDLLDLIVQVAHSNLKGERIIASGENITIKELFRIIAARAKRRPPQIKLPNLLLSFLGTIGDFMNSVGLKGPLTSENAVTARMFHWFDHSKARRLFNFQPRSAEIAINESVDWMIKNGLVEVDAP